MGEREIRSVLVLGDSLSRGVVYDDQKKRYCFLKDDSFVNAVSRDVTCAVHNFSKFGTTVSYAEALLQPKLEATAADAVLIEFGGNDCDFDWNQVALSPLSPHQPKTRLEEFSAALERMVLAIQESGKIPLLMTLPPLNAPSYFNWFTGGDREKQANILKWLGDVGRIYWWHERYSSAIVRIGRRTGTRIIDVRGEFLAQEDFRIYLCSDGIHPNAKGHGIMARAVENFIRVHAAWLMATPAACI